MLGKIAEVEFRIMKEACEFIRQLDSQKESGAALYGGGYLLSDSAAEAKAEAEKTAKIIIEKRLDEKNVMGGGIVWELSDREKEIIRKLNTKGE